MLDPMHAPTMIGSRDFKSWFLKTPAGALVGEAAVSAAYASYRKSYAQQALQVFFRHHFREEWLQKRYEPCTLVAAFQESHEASLQRLKAWKNWRQGGGVISYSHDSSVADDEPLCAEATQQTLCSTSNSIIFVPTVPASVSRAGLQAAFGSLAGLNEVIPGPVRADLGFTRRVWVHFLTPAAAAAAASILKGQIMLPLAGAVSCRLSNKCLAGEQRRADLELSSAAGIRLCVGIALDLASKLDELVGLGSGGGAAVIASEPAAEPILQWWSEFSRYLLQTDAESSEQTHPEIPTDAADASILDACIHYLRAVHLVDFYTGKVGGSVLDLCRTVGPRPPCRQPPPEQQPNSDAVMSKAKALLHTHRPHLSALTASREFSQTPDAEGATLSNFLQDWERLYPEVCVRAQPPPLPGLTPGNTPSPRFSGRGLTSGHTFLVHSPQAHAAFMSQSSNTTGRSPQSVILEPLDQSRVVATYADLVISSSNPDAARSRAVFDMCNPSY